MAQIHETIFQRGLPGGMESLADELSRNNRTHEKLGDALSPGEAIFLRGGLRRDGREIPIKIFDPSGVIKKGNPNVEVRKLPDPGL